jgi:hypothetical protein
MTIINSVNTINQKSATPTLADKSLRSFKNIKPEVQSSRICRPDHSKQTAKNEPNYCPGFSREKAGERAERA